MSRRIIGKIVISADLIAQTPISVGGVNKGVGVDLELAVNGAGELYVPGSSLMGPVRHWVEHRMLDGEAAARSIFGFQEDEQETIGDPGSGEIRRGSGLSQMVPARNKLGHASFLHIEDATIKLPHGLSSEIRDGIQIDRKTGTAREHRKYTREMVPRASRIPLKMELDLPGDKAAEFCQILDLILAAFRDGQIRLGASKTRGFGKVSLRDATTHRYNFAENDGRHLFNWLRGEPPAEADESKYDLSPANNVKLREGDSLLSFEIGWCPVTPVMMKAGREGIMADMIPLVSGTADHKVSPVLTGSGLKGILKSHAAKIVRTLWPAAPSVAAEDPNPDGCLELLNDLFGGPEQAGRIHIDDVYQKDNEISLDDWVSEERDAMNSSTTHEDHVAIDRFTGGASDGALYSARTPIRNRSWEPIRVTVDFSRPIKNGAFDNWKKKNANGGEPPVKELRPDPFHSLPATALKAEFALLLFVLRDLQHGMIPIGFATRRGMGEIVVTAIDFYGRVDSHEVSINWKSGEDWNIWIAKILASIPGLPTAWKQACQYEFRHLSDWDSSETGAPA